MDQYITVAIVWLPDLLTWTCILFTLPGCHKLRAKPEHPIPTFIMKDTFETPYLPAYAIALLCFAMLARNRTLKSILFCTIFATMLAIRCLSSFSGFLRPAGGFWVFFTLSAA
jgi:hypothetical protein